MFGLTPIPLYLIIGLIFTNVFTLTAWRMASSEAKVLKAEIAADDSKDQLRDAKAALADATATIEKNNQVLAVVAKQEAAIAQLTKEKNNALRQLTTGRRCLDGAAVRVLNATAVPDPVAESVQPDAAFATDTDVGEWIVGAQQSYDTCRARIDGIAAFYEAGK